MATSVKEQTTDLRNFKSVNTYFRPYNIPKDHLAFALNVDFTEDGKIVQRPGTRVVKKFDYKPNTFVSHFVNQAQVEEVFWCVSNDTLYKYNDTTEQFDVVNNTLAPAEVWNGTTYVNKFIFGNSVKNYVYNYADGTVAEVNISSDPNVGHMPTGTLFEVFAQRVWAAGDGTENVYYSNVGDPTTWDINDFIAFGGRVNALKTVAEFLFVGTDTALYKITQTGDATIPFRADMLVPYGIVPNGIFPIRGTMVGALTTDGKLVVFDPYIQTGSQVDDRIGLPIYDVLQRIDTTKKFSVRQVYNKIYLAGTFKNDYLGIGSIVLNTNTFGWSFYTPRVYDAVLYKDNVYFSCGQNYIKKMDADYYQDETLDDQQNIVGEDFQTYIITPIFGGDTPEYRKNWRTLDITTASKTKTEFSFSYAINLSQLFNDVGTASYYQADARLGYALLGHFVLGGSWAQRGKIMLDVNSNGLMLKIEKKSSNSDFQIGRLRVSYYPSYRQ